MHLSVSYFRFVTPFCNPYDVCISLRIIHLPYVHNLGNDSSFRIDPLITELGKVSRLSSRKMRCPIDATRSCILVYQQLHPCIRFWHILFFFWILIIFSI